MFAVVCAGLGGKRTEHRAHGRNLSLDRVEWSISGYITFQSAKNMEGASTR
jgi:hypothetical protein